MLELLLSDTEYFGSILDIRGTEELVSTSKPIFCAIPRGPSSAISIDSASCAGFASLLLLLAGDLSLVVCFALSLLGADNDTDFDGSDGSLLSGRGFFCTGFSSFVVF